MGSYKIAFTVFFLFFCVVTQFGPTISHHNTNNYNGVVADQIETNYSNTFTGIPTSCDQIKSNETTTFGLLKGKTEIAEFLVNCLVKNAKTLEGIASKLIPLAPDEKLKSIIEDCEKGYVQEEEDLNQASVCLKKHDIFSAKQYVLASLACDINCHKNLLVYKWGLLGQVLHGMDIHEELSKQAVNYISSLSP